ncbi:hypothetical protein V1503_18790 [Bacillus sp. SCS-151]|uniref:hypothetical protein n=1 Tax=Nanhaiella sioensis TaxID=3115293 RepID=UPI003978B66A
MANYFYLTLDTTAPSNATISIEWGAAYTTDHLVTLSIGTTDGDTDGYQMMIWGDVNTTYDSSVQTAKGDSSWISYNNSKQIKLSDGDEKKFIYLKIRDDVWNESEEVSESINLDTTIPTVTLTNPDVSIVSKNIGKNVASFSFSSDEDFTEFKVKVVNATGAAHDTGTEIDTTHGSVNTSGDEGYSANTPINVQVTGDDIEQASSGDGQKVIKVFIKDHSGKWSV